MKELKVLTVFGTRPEAIKMAPLVLAMQENPGFKPGLVVTAQHREMMDQVLTLFDLCADYDLNIMKKGQSLSFITETALRGLEGVIVDFKPDLVLVHGDTSTTLAGALAAYYQQIDIGHVEAGLRTYDKYQPFPEEMNRHLTGVLADHHFAPTERAALNLQQEGVFREKILITGNTVIDALLMTVKKPCSFEEGPLADVDFNLPTILLTAHRRENWGKPMERICQAVKKLLKDLPDLQVIYPMHRNPTLREQVFSCLGNLPRLFLIEPLDYLHFSHLMDKCTLVLSDSGGIQEEAPALGKPVLVLREKTERPEAVEAETVKLVGSDSQRIYTETKLLLENEELYKRMSRAQNPFGDGQASRRICQYLLDFYRGNKK